MLLSEDGTSPPELVVYTIHPSSCTRLKCPREQVQQLLHTMAHGRTFLEAMGLLSAIVMHSNLIRDQHFKCVSSTPRLTAALHVGRLNDCRRTSPLLEAIRFTLIELNALPDWETGKLRDPPLGKSQDLPLPIYNWWRRGRGDLVAALQGHLSSQ